MEPTSLLNADVTALITGFAGDIVPTVLALVAILIPVGLTLWAIGFGVRKGIAFIQKKGFSRNLRSKAAKGGNVVPFYFRREDNMLSVFWRL
jgi:hypothetical protein